MNVICVTSILVCLHHQKDNTILMNLEESIAVPVRKGAGRIVHVVCVASVLRLFQNGQFLS
jgi:hypothetical protein